MEFTSNKPIYIQIVEYYENLIDTGVLKEGDELPSVREIALIYGINPNTVQRAFSILVENNYVRSVPKKGFYVNKINKDNKKIIKNAIENLYSLGISKDEIVEYLKGDDHK